MLRLGSTFPDFEADATGVAGGKFKLYEYLGESWGLFMSHPADFTPVCTTELAQAMKLHEEFEKRNCKVLAYSCNDVETHKLAAKYPIATPEGWTPGNKVMVPPNVSSEEIQSKLKKGVETQSCPSGKEYLRFTPDPST